MVKISPVLNSQSKIFLLEFFYTWAVFENGDSIYVTGIGALVLNLH